MKRFLDLAVSSVVLTLSAPIFAAIAVAINVDSKGPILFIQRRVGKGGEPFLILKFRTMLYRDPDSVDQFAERVITDGSDPRITRVGRVLRSSSLDELPQLMNVLRGEMSLVGPRPILVDQLAAVPSEHYDRFSVRPGLTGLAQVRGRRGLGWLDQLKADSEYAANPSVLNDIVILARTVKVVLSRGNVYADESKNWRAYIPDSSLPDGTTSFLERTADNQ